VYCIIIYAVKAFDCVLSLCVCISHFSILLTCNYVNVSFYPCFTVVCLQLGSDENTSRWEKELWAVL